MPTYEYVCTKCGHPLEAVQSFSDPALTTCPQCEGALRKVYGNVGIVLKGSGFYKTDSRKLTSNGSGKAAEGSVKASDSTTSDAKKSGTAEKSPPSSSSSTSEKAPTT
jgi:putative FmdB family regulatory protein